MADDTNKLTEGGASETPSGENPEAVPDETASQTKAAEDLASEEKPEEGSAPEEKPEESSESQEKPAEVSAPEEKPEEVSAPEEKPAEVSESQTNAAGASPSQKNAPGASPSQTKPAEASPSQTKPAEASPSQTKPAEISMSQTNAAGASPSQTNAAEASASQTNAPGASHSQTNPAEASPSQTKPAETSPSQTKPAEISMSQTNAAGASPSQTKPAEASPSQTKPAEISMSQTKAAASAETDPDVSIEVAEDLETSAKDDDVAAQVGKSETQVKEPPETEKSNDLNDPPATTETKNSEGPKHPTKTRFITKEDVGGLLYEENGGKWILAKTRTLTQQDVGKLLLEKDGDWIMDPSQVDKNFGGQEIDGAGGSTAYESDGGNWVLEKSPTDLPNSSGSEPVALPQTEMSSSQNPVQSQSETNPLTESIEKSPDELNNGGGSTAYESDGGNWVLEKMPNDFNISPAKNKVQSTRSYVFTQEGGSMLYEKDGQWQLEKTPEELRGISSADAGSNLPCGSMTFDTTTIIIDTLTSKETVPCNLCDDPNQNSEDPVFAWMFSTITQAVGTVKDYMGPHLLQDGMSPSSKGTQCVPDPNYNSELKINPNEGSMSYEKDGDWSLESSPDDLLTGPKPKSKPAEVAKSAQALESKTQIGDEDINIELVESDVKDNEGKEAVSKTAVDSQQASKTEVVKSEAAILESKEPSTTSELALEPESPVETTNLSSPSATDKMAPAASNASVKAEPSATEDIGKEAEESKTAKGESSPSKTDATK